MKDSIDTESIAQSPLEGAKQIDASLKVVTSIKFITYLFFRFKPGYWQMSLSVLHT